MGPASFAPWRTQVFGVDDGARCGQSPDPAQGTILIDHSVAFAPDAKSEPETAGAGSLERRFEIAAQAAGLGVWQWDLVRSAFVYSARAKAIYGFPQDQPVIYEMVASATHPDDRARTLALAARSFDPNIRAKERYRYRIVRPDNGQVRWVLAFGEAEFGAVDGEIRALSYIGTLQDITEQKQAEDALAASEARLRLAVEAGRMAVWEFDPATNTITHSEQLNRLCGFPPDATPTIEEFRSRYAPGERERMEREGAAMLARGETQIETEIRHIWPTAR